MKKTIPVLILLAVLLTVVSCGGGGEAANNGTSESSVMTAETTVETTTTESTYPEPRLPALDAEGTEFKILCLASEKIDSRFHSSEFEAISQNGEPLNDSIYSRNLVVEEKLGIKIKPILVDKSWTEPQNLIKTSVLAGDGAYDMVSVNLVGSVVNASNGYTYVFNDLPYIDAEAPWWLPELNRVATIGNKRYLMSGYLNFQTFDATGALFFNKAMVNKYKLDSPYIAVNDGSWTLDKLENLSKGLSRDLDGDGKMTEKDQYGFATNNSTWLQFFVSCNCSSVEKDKDDIPQLKLDSAKNITTLEKIIKLLNDESAVLLAERITGWPYTAGERNERLWIPNDAFTEDRSLLFADLVCNIRTLRDMEVDFGVIPAPKYDEKQENYSVYLHQTHGTTTQVPITVKDIELTGAVIEYMCYQSYQHIRPALFETVLGTKYVRDDESVFSLDIILSSSRMDFGVVMNIKLDVPVRTLVATGDTSVASTLETNKSANEAKINDIVKKLSELK